LTALIHWFIRARARTFCGVSRGPTNASSM
jgi:hypothetical protein